jgi:hypothetical protein
MAILFDDVLAFQQKWPSRSDVSKVKVVHPVREAVGLRPGGGGGLLLDRLQWAGDLREPMFRSIRVPSGTGVAQTRLSQVVSKRQLLKFQVKEDSSTYQLRVQWLPEQAGGGATINPLKIEDKHCT